MIDPAAKRNYRVRRTHGRATAMNSYDSDLDQDEAGMRRKQWLKNAIEGFLVLCIIAGLILVVSTLWVWDRLTTCTTYCPRYYLVIGRS